MSHFKSQDLRTVPSHHLDTMPELGQPDHYKGQEQDKYLCEQVQPAPAQGLTSLPPTTRPARVKQDCLGQQATP
jgi:hypothetical protein